MEVGHVSVFIWNYTALRRTGVRPGTAKRVENLTSMYV